ncbi:MAG TPA: DUF4389 domain-containing protein [Gammaproteobacteria bacterium]|nr:DUF4389 domain-containing protein [Gammaproteobacteria bacterium]
MTKLEKTIQRESIVLRVLWMLLFLLVWQIAVPLLAILVVAQLLYRLFFGAPSAHFMSFGDSLGQYLAQIGRFAVFNTDAKPWPVADWPRAHVADGETAHVPKAKTPAEDVASVTVASVAESEPVVESENVAEVAGVAETQAVEETPDETPIVLDDQSAGDTADDTKS